MRTSRPRPSRYAFAASAAAALLLAGCASLQPEALRSAEIAETAHADKLALARGVEPLNGPLTLEDAIARAIKYNAERRLKAMEEAIAAGTLDVGRYDMLPKLVAAAGYHSRNNDLTTRSKDSVTGAPSLANPFISSDRSASTTDLGFSWSLLDFGQSYYAARQNADRVLIAAEHRRKSLHNLIQDVRTAYWRVVAAQQLIGTLRSTIAEAEAALADARQAENERQRSPVEPLRYQRQVLENLRLLETIEQELSTARIELAALASLPLAHSFTVVEPAAGVNTVWLDVSVDKMEERALLNNPDLRESIYNGRIAQQETRRTLLKIFPGLSFNYAVKTSNDSYLINQNWNEVGAQLSLNLLGLLAAPAQMRLADAGVMLADQKRMTTQMAVLTQLHIARLQYANAAHQFARADAIAAVDARLAGHVANQEEAGKQTRLDRVAQQTATILSQLRRYQALSNAQTAAAKLQATLGLEPLIGAQEDIPLADLRAAVGRAIVAWNSGSAALLSTPEEKQAPLVTTSERK
ncbi:MAG: TolC family protein [Sulfuricella sp.]|nr:TolC family protein [Sulfuricella sp.]